MSRATRIGSALAGLAVATGMLAYAPVAQAAQVGVSVQDNDFSPADQEAFTGDDVWFVLDPNAVGKHTVTSVQPGLFDHLFDPSAPRQTQFLRVVFDTAGDYQYFCKIHGADIMSGVVRVSDTGPTTTTEPPNTTTTAPPTTTTTTPPTTATTTPTSATTTPTTRPATTTSTTRPSTTTAPTAAPTTATTAPKVSGASEPVTTTTKKKPTTTTTKKKKAETPDTVAPVEETTTTLLPSLTAALPSGVGEVPTTTSDLPEVTEAEEEAASGVVKEGGGKSGRATKKTLLALGGLGALTLGGAGWRWYNRSSRYLPA